MGHIHAESPSEAETDQRSARLGVDVLSKACFDEFPPSRSEPREALDRGSFVHEERAVSRADLGEDYINVYSLASGGQRSSIVWRKGVARQWPSRRRMRAWTASTKGRVSQGGGVWPSAAA